MQTSVFLINKKYKDESDFGLLNIKMSLNDIRLLGEAEVLIHKL